MIRQRVMPLSVQELPRLLRRVTRPGVHDPATPRGARCAAWDSSCFFDSFFGAIRYWMFGRSKRRHEGSRPGRAARDLLPVACVAVSARSAARPASARAAPELQVVGPEVVPHCDTQCALVDRDHLGLRDAASSSSLPGAAQAAPARGRAGRARRLELLLDDCAPGSWWSSEVGPDPRCRSACTWSCMSAISGEITIPVPRRTSAAYLVAQRLPAAGRHQHERRRRR